MARAVIARPSKTSVREVELVLERVHEKPVKSKDGWVQVPVQGDEYALYRDAGKFPRKMYLSRDECEELLGMIAQELGSE